MPRSCSTSCSATHRCRPLFAIANIALVNNQPETLNIREMLQCFIDHRKVVIRRRSRFLLRRCRNRAHILEGLILAVSDIDEIIEIIKKVARCPHGQAELDEEAASADANWRRSRSFCRKSSSNPGRKATIS